jgi:hypothetical protein
MTLQEKFARAKSILSKHTTLICVELESIKPKVSVATMKINKNAIAQAAGKSSGGRAPRPIRPGADNNDTNRNGNPNQAIAQVACKSSGGRAPRPIRPDNNDTNRNPNPAPYVLI